MCWPPHNVTVAQISDGQDELIAPFFRVELSYSLRGYITVMIFEWPGVKNITNYNMNNYS